jgi:CubicO group peptidase (beta-lactamase class C family)
MSSNRPLAAVLAILLAVAAWPARAQTAQTIGDRKNSDLEARVDAFIGAEMTAQRIPGVSLAILRDGKPLVMKGYGLANVEHHVPVTADTVFQSGSMGKQFVAMAVAMLAREGRLSLDDPLTKFFPDAPEGWRRITVRHLLHQTSGLGDYPPDFDLRRDFTEAEMLKTVEASPLAFAPGERWSYSNLGYVTLGLLVHQVTGEFYGDVLRERIFAPLGMGSSAVISESRIVPNRAAGYRLLDGELANQEWVAPSVNTTADGSLYLTTRDMARWDAALDGERLLPRSAMAEVFSEAPLNDGGSYPYGFGWFVAPLRGHRAQFHGGAWQGFQTFILRFPDDNLAIVLFTNLREANAFRITRGIASLFHPELALPERAPIADRDPQLTAKLRRVLSQIADHAADPADFTAEARAKLFPDEIERVGDTLRTLSLPVAVIHFSELVERRDDGALHVHRYLLTDLGVALDCTVAVDDAGKVARIAVAPR